MSLIDLSLDDALAMTPVEQGNHASKIVTSPLLRQELLAGDIVSRKEFCDVLGVQESTLTRWLQDDPPPKTAAVAYVLLATLKEARDEIYRLRETARDSIVVATGEGFAVSDREYANDGKMVARIVADHIPTLGQARRLAAAISSKTVLLLEDCEHIINNRLITIDDQSLERRLRSLSMQLSDLRTVLVDNYDQKELRARSLPGHDELIAQSDADVTGERVRTTGASNENVLPLHKLAAEIYGQTAISSLRYRDDIINALLKFSMTYREHRSAVIASVEEIRKRRGATIPRTFDNTVQRAFEDHCGEADGFDKPEKLNLFCFPEGKWQGIWGLNETNVRAYLDDSRPASLDDI